MTPDAAAKALGGDLPPVDALGAYVAAIREAFEEVGILLADHHPTADLGDAREPPARLAPGLASSGR